MKEKRNSYQYLVGYPEGSRLIRRFRHRWEDNIKTDFREIECGGVNWVDLRIGAGGRLL
jgi:hypothetical protein